MNPLARLVRLLRELPPLLGRAPGRLSHAGGSGGVWGGALLLIAGVAAAAHVGPARRIVRLNLPQALHVE